jgi:AcrR family transcriptional regulator
MTSTRPTPVTGRSADDGTMQRVDARSNRNRILSAARETFATRGNQVPIASIARAAGVGVATLYRHFPTRSELLTQACSQHIARCFALVDEALQSTDPWAGFCTMIDRICTMQITDPGYTSFPSRSSCSDHEAQIVDGERKLALLVQRTKDSGQLRTDFDVSDIYLFLRAVEGVRCESQQESLVASRRLVGYMLQSFGTRDAHVLPAPALHLLS